MVVLDLSRHASNRCLAVAALCAVLTAAAPDLAAARTLHYDFVAGEAPMGSASVYLGTQRGDWPEGTTFAIEAREVGNQQLELTIRDFFIPPVPFPFGESFQFELLDGDLNPTDTLHLSATIGPLGHWQVNPTMDDPMLKVRVMEKSHSGTIRREDVLSVPMTTSAVTMDPCPNSPPPGIVGEPMDPGTGGMALVGAVCIDEFDYLSGAELPFLLNLEGVMAAPEPSAGTLGVAAIAALGLARRRRTG